MDTNEAEGGVVGGVARAATNVRVARDAYLEENGFALAGYVADTVTIRAFGRDVMIENRPARKQAIPLHDLHHVATGYGTDMTGEGEIAAWELGAGCRTAVVYALNVAASVIAFFLAPVRVVRAFATGLRQRTLYRAARDYGELLALDVGALRSHLGIPQTGNARGERRLHEAAPARMPRTSK